MRVHAFPSTSERSAGGDGCTVISVDHSWSSRGAQHCGIPHQLRWAIYSMSTDIQFV